MSNKQSATLAIVDEFSSEFKSGTNTLTQIILEFLMHLKERRRIKQLQAELQYIHALRIALDKREQALKSKESKQGGGESAEETGAKSVQQKEGAYSNSSGSLSSRPVHTRRAKRKNKRLSEQNGYSI